MSEPCVFADEVSGCLGIAKDAIYQCIEPRGLPAHHFSRLRKFKLSEVDAWVERGGAGDDHGADQPNRGQT